MLAATLGLVGRPVERTNCALAAARHGSVGGGASSRPVVAARLARVHEWRISPRAGNGTPRWVAVARLDGQRTPRTAEGAAGP